MALNHVFIHLFVRSFLGTRHGDSSVTQGPRCPCWAAASQNKSTSLFCLCTHEFIFLNLLNKRGNEGLCVECCACLHRDKGTISLKKPSMEVSDPRKIHQPFLQRRHSIHIRSTECFISSTAEYLFISGDYFFPREKSEWHLNEKALEGAPVITKASVKLL